MRLGTAVEPRFRVRSLALTETEARILNLVAEGLLNCEIAARLTCSEQTVKNHVTATFRKLGAQNRTELVVIAARRGIIDICGESKRAQLAHLDALRTALENALSLVQGQLAERP